MSPATAEVSSLNPGRSLDRCPVLYGPVQSRRLGLSLGVNLLPAGEKACNFDCLYCECGWTPWLKTQRSWFCSLEALEKTLSEDFPVLVRSHPSLETMTFSGNGEPTLFPEFSAAVAMVDGFRRRLVPWVRLAILTNGTKLGEKALFDAVRRIDIKCVKLDAASGWMNRPRESVSVAQLIPIWAELPNLTIQSFFSEGRFDNTAEIWVEPWIQQIKAIRPRRVQLYTLHRAPAVGLMQKASLSTLNRIGRQLASEACTEVQIFD